MNIGFVSTRLAGVDGVSLETAKIVKVLERMGHKCFYAAGELDPDGPPGRLVPEMSFNEIIVKAMHDQVFIYSEHPTPAVFQLVYDDAEVIRRELEAFVEEFDIQILVPQNACTIPMNLSLGVAIRDFVARTRIHTICHHHDFYWERDRFLNNGIQDILDEAFPPRLEPIQHMVISTIMQRRLHSWLGVYSTYLPNVFDFKNPPPPMDDYALSFRAEMGLTEQDIIVLQPTRIIRRKAIEKAIALVRKLNDPRMILLITGYEGDEVGEYGLWLREEAERAGIRYRFIAEWVGERRGERNGHKVFSLWDIYPNADLITYPSVYEGFGNALIETLYFRKPLVVHTYPAYLVDIKPTGVRAIEFSHEITEGTLDAVREVLKNKALREEIADHNYAVGLKHFSFERMEATLRRVLAAYRDPWLPRQAVSSD